MNICGIDYSINSPAIIKAKLDNDLEINKLTYLGFTDVKKIAKTDNNIIHYDKKKQFKNNYEKYIWIREHIINFINKSTYVAIEGYAYSKKGLVFNIAESTMCTKIAIYERKIPIRIYDPSTIKMYATFKGNVGKDEMNLAYENYKDLKLDLSHLPSLKSPKEDFVDAFYILKLLQLEMKLRHGMISLKDLPLKHIEIFNRVTKANPVNLLAQDFISKKDTGE